MSSRAHNKNAPCVKFITALDITFTTLRRMNPFLDIQQGLLTFKRLSVHKGKPEEDQNCEISKPHLPEKWINKWYIFP